MLARENRLRSAEDFRSTIKLGQKATTAHMVVYLNRNSSQDQPKFGVVVSKLVGNAVQRNLVKRRAKAALHNRMDKFKLGDSLVVRALPGLAEIKFDQMNQELDQAITSLQGKGEA